MANLTKLEGHLVTRSYIEGCVVLFSTLIFLLSIVHRWVGGPQANMEGRGLLVP